MTIHQIKLPSGRYLRVNRIKPGLKGIVPYGNGVTRSNANHFLQQRGISLNPHDQMEILTNEGVDISVLQLAISGRRIETGKDAPYGTIPCTREYFPKRPEESSACRLPHPIVLSKMDPILAICCDHNIVMEIIPLDHSQLDVLYESVGLRGLYDESVTDDSGHRVSDAERYLLEFQGEGMHRLIWTFRLRTDEELGQLLGDRTPYSVHDIKREIADKLHNDDGSMVISVAFERAENHIFVSNERRDEYAENVLYVDDSEGAVAAQQEAWMHMPLLDSFSSPESHKQENAIIAAANQPIVSAIEARNPIFARNLQINRFRWPAPLHEAVLELMHRSAGAQFHYPYQAPGRVLQLVIRVSPT